MSEICAQQAKQALTGDGNKGNFGCLSQEYLTKVLITVQ